MRSHRELARYAAPVAFLAAVTIAVLLVRAGLRADDVAAPATTTRVTATTVATTATATRRTTTARTATAAPRFYRIEPGDTLDQVALEHGTTVERLLELNPGLDINALQIGQRIRVA